MKTEDPAVLPKYRNSLTKYMYALCGLAFGEATALDTFLRIYDKSGKIIPERDNLYQSDLNFIVGAHDSVASLADSPSSDVVMLGDRIKVASRSWGLSAADIAQAMGVTPDEVLEWQAKQALPKELQKLAIVLHVPTLWLEEGGGYNLPAYSPIGFRQGPAGEESRRKLYRMTQHFLAQLPAEYDWESRHQLIVEKVRSRGDFSNTARHGGGYWQITEDNSFVFEYWSPIYWGLCEKKRAHGNDNGYLIAPIYRAWFELLNFQSPEDNGRLFFEEQEAAICAS